jgi:biotin carboxyl carrier protein
MIVRVKIDNETYEVVIENLDERPVKAKVGDEVFEIWPDEEATTIPIMPQKPIASQPLSQNQPALVHGDLNLEHALKSPLPGVITEIAVHPGDKVQAGQEVMRLEAMKMSNIIRTTRTGTVARIHVTKNQQVKHGDILITLD